MQKTDRQRVNNPGAGHCGFYAFAIGLINLIIHHDRQDLFDAWVQKDATIEHCLRGIITTIRSEGFHQRITHNSSLMFPLAKSLQTILMNNCHEQIELVKRDVLAKVVQTTLPFLHFGELVEQVLKESDVFFKFNPLFYNEKLRSLARLIAIESKKEVNDYYESIYPGVKAVLSRAINPRHDAGMELAFVSFHEMVDEISRANQNSKKLDISKNPLFANPSVMELAQKFAKTDKPACPSFFQQLDSMQNNMVVQALVKYDDEFKKAYRVYIDGYSRCNRIFSQFFSQNQPWYATHQELTCLSEAFNVSLCCLADGVLQSTSALSGSIFVNNEGGAHWTTFIYQQQPLMHQSPPSSTLPKTKEQILQTRIIQQEDITQNIQRVEQVLPELLTHSQVKVEQRKLELLNLLASQGEEAAILQKIDQLEMELNDELMQKAAHKIKQLPDVNLVPQMAPSPSVFKTVPSYSPFFSIPSKPKEAPRPCSFKIHDEIALKPSKPIAMVSGISPYWSIPFGLGLGELIILAAPQLVSCIALHLAMSIFQAHLFVLLLTSLLMMISVLYSEKAIQGEPYGAPQLPKP